MSKRAEFIGYEYKSMTVRKHMEPIYADGFENFGWELESAEKMVIGSPGKVKLNFRRDRKIRNKAELTRLQRQFDGTVKAIEKLEDSKTLTANGAAIFVGILGTAFLAGGTFAYLAGMIVLMVILAVPGFLGWGSAFFVFRYVLNKKEEQVAPVIESKYDELYEITKQGNELLPL